MLTDAETLQSTPTPEAPKFGEFDVTRAAQETTTPANTPAVALDPQAELARTMNVYQEPEVRVETKISQEHFRFVIHAGRNLRAARNHITGV